MDTLPCRLPLFTRSSRRISRSACNQTPKRHPGRVEKPRSVHQSPQAHAPLRRRPFTSTKQCNTLDDGHRKIYGEPLEDDRELQPDSYAFMSRPASRCPSAAHFSIYGCGIAQRSANAGSVNLSVSQDMRGDVVGTPYSETPNGYSSVAMSPNDSYPIEMNLISPSLYEQGQIWQSSAMWTAYTKAAMEVRSRPPLYPTTVEEQASWAFPGLGQTDFVPAAATDDLPHQHPRMQHSGMELYGLPEQHQHMQKMEDSGILVGLGLYDGPESTWLTYEGERKSLKLEEEWEPPEMPEEDCIGDEPGRADDLSSEDEEEGAPEPPLELKNPWAAALQPTLAAPMGNMAGQSCFFDDGEAVANESWDQQLKQPTAEHARIRYDWLRGA